MPAIHAQTALSILSIEKIASTRKKSGYLPPAGSKMVRRLLFFLSSPPEEPFSVCGRINNSDSNPTANVKQAIEIVCVKFF